MKILVTGSNGCVGSSLKSLCSEEDNWVFIERKDCDLTNRERTIDLVRTIGPDYIIHLASYVPGFYNIDKVSSFSNNVRINENVLEASNLAGIQNGMFCLSVNMFPEMPALPSPSGIPFWGRYPRGMIPPKSGEAIFREGRRFK